MKYKRFFVAHIGLLSVIFISAGTSYFPQTELEKSTLEMSISSRKAAYKKGELVDITFRLENKGSEKISINHAPHPSNGGISFFVSKDDASYLHYLNPEWGKGGAPGLKHLEPGQSTESVAGILWNAKPYGLNPRAAARVRQGRILTDYAFVKAGSYLVKATFNNGRINIEAPRSGSRSKNPREKIWKFGIKSRIDQK